MEEIWKNVRGYEGLYQVSNLGNVRSSRRNIILKQSKYSKYNQVNLYKNCVRRTFNVHRLVATAFLNNPNNYECINHIDENKRNNVVSNLEWCSKKYNVNYGSGNKKSSNIRSKYKIIQRTLDGKIIKTWNNVWELREDMSLTNNKIWLIRKNCRRQSKTAYGYVWEYQT